MQSRTVVGIVVVIAVAVAAYYFWPKDAAAPMNEQNGQAAQQQNPAQGTSEVSQGTLAAQMSGTWKSDQDGKFTREIRQDGVMIDRYEGDATAGVNGEWTVVNPALESALADVDGGFSDVSVIKVSWEGGAEVTFFAINALEANKMTITDLSGRGGVTTFTKVN